MAVGPDGLGPLVTVRGPHGHVVVQVVRQVVGHQVLARHAYIHGVPELKLPAQLLQGVARDGRLGHGGVLKEDVVPHLGRHLLRSERDNNYNKKHRIGSIRATVVTLAD